MALKGTSCVRCNSPVQPNWEICPHCGQGLHAELCSFCGASMEADDFFCPDCGNPRTGIICPDCNTLNFRSFCRKCNRPLNEMAMQGYIAYKGYSSLREIMNGDQSSHMKMGDMT